ncbi:Hsp20/alpha crystallin family protein [Aquimarina sp. MMG015]|uniref:Hsp20/alpha crystallin family protein n=1 Tax=Aquimarina TaxID=290174 RepID=UPI0004098D5B|nr:MULTISPECIES: Hsp20/alpha crystallin family protein [Aquimarina]AXT58519.1 Hsp20/alpha crystallin family protein [Aquimarina sp. AD1]MBQ4805631.1 Hsp20/alpha crystallin family protein [Aquimarina sp. MMG015]RKN37556.1 Hsp20/alpha crystallin family protein [Aquimarina sp. AD1]
MSLIKRTDRLPLIFDDIFNTDWFGGIANEHKIGFNTPAVNVKESDNDFIIELAAPGLVKEDFNIELDNDVLTISSETKNEAKEEKDNYTRKEFSYQTFKRSFNLPDTVNIADILASYDNGVLLVKLPKKEEAKVQPKRLIEIS